MYGSTIYAWWTPTLLVNDVFNAVFVHGNMLGDGMFYGSGAGKLPTASAVVADVVDMVRYPEKDKFLTWNPEKITLVDYKDSVNTFFVRTTSDKAAVEKAFGEVEFVENVVNGELGFVTKAMTEAEFEAKANEIALVNRIRLG